MAAALDHGQGSQVSEGSARSGKSLRKGSQLISVTSQPLLELIQDYRKHPLLQLSKYLTAGRVLLIRMEYATGLRWNVVSLVGKVPSTTDIFHVENRKLNFKRIVRLSANSAWIVKHDAIPWDVYKYILNQTNMKYVVGKDIRENEDWNNAERYPLVELLDITETQVLGLPQDPLEEEISKLIPLLTEKANVLRICRVSELERFREKEAAHHSNSRYPDRFRRQTVRFGGESIPGQSHLSSPGNSRKYTPTPNEVGEGSDDNSTDFGHADNIPEDTAGTDTPGPKSLITVPATTHIPLTIGRESQATPQSGNQGARSRTVTPSKMRNIIMDGLKNATIENLEIDQEDLEQQIETESRRLQDLEEKGQELERKKLQVQKADQDLDLKLSLEIQKDLAEEVQKKKMKDEAIKHQRKVEEEALSKRHTWEMKRQKEREVLALKVKAKKEELELAIDKLASDEIQIQEKSEKLRARMESQLRREKLEQDRTSDRVSVATTQVEEGRSRGYLFGDNRQAEHEYKARHLLHMDINSYQSPLIHKLMRLEKNLYVEMRRLASVTNEGADPERILDRLYCVQEREVEFLRGTEEIILRSQEVAAPREEIQELTHYLDVKQEDQAIDCLTNRLQGVRMTLAIGFQTHHPDHFVEHKDLIMNQPGLPPYSAQQMDQVSMERTQQWAANCSGDTILTELEDIEVDTLPHLTVKNRQEALAKSTDASRSLQALRELTEASGDLRGTDVPPILPTRDLATGRRKDGQSGTGVMFDALDSLRASSILEGTNSDKYQQSFHSTGSKVVKNFVEGGENLLNLFSKLEIKLDSNAQTLAKNLETKGNNPLNSTIAKPPNL